MILRYVGIAPDRNGGFFMKKYFDVFYKGGNTDFTGKFKENWIFLLITFACLAVICVAAFLISKAVKKKKGTASGRSLFTTKAMITASLCLALAFILSYIKLFSLPLGGSITLVSALPLIIFGYIYGYKYSFFVTFAYSLLQVIQGAWILNAWQLILDYFVAFTVLGIAGLFRKNIFLGTVSAYTLRYAAHTAAAFLFYSEYAPEGISVASYCLLYNLAFLLPEMILCLIVLAIPATRRMINELRKQK